MVQHYSKMLHATWLGWAVAGGVPWLWPAFATLHFLGMALLVGSVGTIDLRMLGVARALPLEPLRKLMPWAAAGFVVNLVTGIGFYAGHPEQYQNAAFAAKMAFILLAGANAMFYYRSGLARRVDPTPAGRDVPFAAKVVASLSLLLWLGVIFWGRMLPLFSPGF